MPSKHKHPPVSFRPRTEADRAWLLRQAAETGRTVNAVLADALAAWRTEREAREPEKDGTDA
jgi:hypothetical protein